MGRKDKKAAASKGGDKEVAKKREKARRASIATPQSREEALETFYGETLTVKLPGVYLGSSIVHVPPENSREKIEEELRAASLRAVSQKLKTKVQVRISDKAVGLLTPKLQTLVQFPTVALAAIQADSKNTSRVMLISRLPSYGITYCHVVDMKKKDTKTTVLSTREMLKTVDRAGAAAASTTQQRNVMSVVDGDYLGSMVVAKPRGDDICAAALKQITSPKRRKDVLATKSIAAIIIVSTDGLRLQEALTQEELSISALSDISHVTVLDEGSAKEVFCFIERNDNLDQSTAHFFKTVKDFPDSLCRAVGRAKDLYLEELEDRAGDPFLPENVDEKLDVPESLLGCQLERHKLTAVKVIGQGQFGTVFLALQDLNEVEEDSEGADNTNDDDGNDDEEAEVDLKDEVQRAVKLLRKTASEADHADFQREAEVMADLKHRNVVELSGVCMVHKPWLVALELMQYGDLKKVLLACKSKQIDWMYIEQLCYARQIAEGMDFIASKGYVHMDVAARNVLVHTDNLVKIADFGLTHKVDPETKKFRLKRHLRLAVRWMAPETLHGKRLYFSERTDVYSFGCLLWEMMTYGALPFGNLRSADAKVAIENGAKLDRPNACTDEFWEIASTCWIDPADDRPVFSTMVEELKKMEEAEMDKSEPPRDIGNHLNKALTQKLRRLSKKASVARKSKMQSFVPAAPLETLAEEEEDEGGAGGGGGATAAATPPAGSMEAAAAAALAEIAKEEADKAKTAE